MIGLVVRCSLEEKNLISSEIHKNLKKNLIGSGVRKKLLKILKI